MDKYYKQVSELQDWTNAVRDHISSNTKMTDALSTYFCSENVIMVNN